MIEKLDEASNLQSQTMRFVSILLEAVDEGLKMLLGESARAAIYFYMERDSSLKKDEIPQRLEDFSSAIHGIFGRGGPLIEKSILRRLCEKLSVDYESVKDNEFPAAVEEVRRSGGSMGGSLGYVEG